MSGIRTPRKQASLVRIFGIVCALMAICGGAAYFAFHRVENPRPTSTVTESIGVNQQFVTNFLGRHLTSLQVDDQGAHFRATPDQSPFCLGNPKAMRVPAVEFVSEFTLKNVGDEFWVPDHHGSSQFQIRSMTLHEIVIAYETTFDATSFGKANTTIDRGEVTLKPFQNLMRE